MMKLLEANAPQALQIFGESMTPDQVEACFQKTPISVLATIPGKLTPEQLREAATSHTWAAARFAGNLFPNESSEIEKLIQEKPRTLLKYHGEHLTEEQRVRCAAPWTRPSHKKEKGKTRQRKTIKKLTGL